MRNILTIVFIFISTCFIKAQTDTLKHAHHNDSLNKASLFYKNTISVNISSFLDRIAKPNVSPDLNSPFLYYSRNFKNYFIRLGINGRNTQNNETNVKTNEQTINNKFYSSASLSFYFTKKISRKFSVAYGINLLMAYVDSSTTFVTTFDKVKNYATSIHYGIAPGILLKYQINKRLAIFAEYTLPIKMIVSKTGTNYSLFPNENTTDRKTINYSSQIYNPISLYLSCSF